MSDFLAHCEDIHSHGRNKGIVYFSTFAIQEKFNRFALRAISFFGWNLLLKQWIFSRESMKTGQSRHVKWYHEPRSASFHVWYLTLLTRKTIFVHLEIRRAFPLKTNEKKRKGAFVSVIKQARNSILPRRITSNQVWYTVTSS